MALANTEKSESINKKKCITPEGRVGYPNLFEPHAFKDGDPKYSVVLTFPKSLNLALPATPKTNSVKAVIHAAIVEKWGEDKKKWPKNIRLPIRDGDEEREGKPEYQNSVFITASSKSQPGVVDSDLSQILNPKTVYPGCYGRAELIASAYSHLGNNGVKLSLVNFQKMRDGKPISGRKDAAEVFDAVATTADSELSYSDENDLFGEADA